ncbi:histidine phosphatase family protein [Amycolatopsis benzoatilytica]|uniref:histidine phosphatase family protein n=1 Tax=Amycolatopsis benzoatilytica TaxID=346045 RepID=UPI000360BB71|nr:histidine phosphatase family protein [Amycolatopsis benzoatilytica]
MRLLLVRHGQTEGNVRRALDTALPGPPLTELGREQAVALAERLREEPIVAVYASQAVRAQQTAAPLAEVFGIAVEVIEGVKEVDAGDLEGKTDLESIGIYLRVVKAWTEGELAVAIPGGETGHEVHDRMRRAAEELRAKHEETSPDGTVVLVSHGGAIRLAGEWLSGNVPAELANRELIPNTEFVELVTEGAGWRCTTWVGSQVS